jgi:hypothetical protein
MLTAVIAAVLTVTTGGPLRCPCQFPQLVCETDRIAESLSADETLNCPCHSHHKSELPPSSEQGRAPAKPCEHGPGIDIAALVTNGERPTVYHDSFDGPELDSILDSHTSQNDQSNGRMLLDCPGRTSESDRLKYCHSFRC